MESIKAWWVFQQIQTKKLRIMMILCISRIYFTLLITFKLDRLPEHTDKDAFSFLSSPTKMFDSV